MERRWITCGVSGIVLVHLLDVELEVARRHVVEGEQELLAVTIEPPVGRLGLTDGDDHLARECVLRILQRDPKLATHAPNGRVLLGFGLWRVK